MSKLKVLQKKISRLQSRMQGDREKLTKLQAKHEEAVKKKEAKSKKKSPKAASKNGQPLGFSPEESKKSRSKIQV